MNQCQIQFVLQPTQFGSEHAKVGFVITCLAGKALEWASPLWEKESPLIDDAKEFQTVSDAPGWVASTSSWLFQIRQGSRRAAEYAIEFRMLAMPLSTIGSLSALKTIWSLVSCLS